ncbi:MAG: RNA methyltransferase [Spirosomataceae bacterium]
MRKLSVEELNRLSVEAFHQIEKFEYALILDNVRSLNNVGSVFRTADAFKASKIYLCGITGTPPHRDIAKTALGADESVAWEHHSDVLVLCQQLQEEGFQILAVEQVEGSLSLANFTPDSTQKYAFVLGNEVFGVNEQVVQLADHCLEIPQFGTKHSLNISVTAGIVCWHYVLHAQLNR